MQASYRSSARNLWSVIFQLQGSVLIAVFPFCVLNCSLLAVVIILAKNGVDIAFSPSGHTLMTLIISFLVISKVNMGYERYMSARNALGDALTTLRELNQLAFTYSEHDRTKSGSEWRGECTTKILDLIDCTMRVIKSEEHALYLALNDDTNFSSDDDPMLLVQSLRIHLYNGCFVLANNLEILERVKLVDLIHEFIHSYRVLLKLASTPLPWPFLQMGRTFLFIWTFSMPLVLRSPFGDASAAMVFLFFLTYGFIGLELVAMKMMSPFGDGVHDLNITGMREATIIGIQNDRNAMGETSQTISQRRLFYSSTKRASIFEAGITMTPSEQQESMQSMYHVMGPSDNTH